MLGVVLPVLVVLMVMSMPATVPVVFGVMWLWLAEGALTVLFVVDVVVFVHFALFFRGGGGGLSDRMTARYGTFRF